MKVRKQLRKLQAMLNADSRERLHQRDELKALLHKMKSKEKHLARKAGSEGHGTHRKHLQQEIALVHAQRKKGLKALKALHD